MLEAVNGLQKANMNKFKRKSVEPKKESPQKTGILKSIPRKDNKQNSPKEKNLPTTCSTISSGRENNCQEPKKVLNKKNKSKFNSDAVNQF